MSLYYCKMSIVVIFIFLSIIVTLSTSQTLKPFKNPDAEVKWLSEEYVRLHLIQDLSSTRRMVFTIDGRNWLRTWDQKRNAILNQILYYNPGTIYQKLQEKWLNRLKLFYDTQENYLQTIVQYYDVRNKSPWPKITFDATEGFTTMMDLSKIEKPNDKNIADPIVMESDVDEVMRFHRPYTEIEEKRVVLIEETLIQDSAFSLVKKKYNIIDKEKLKNLQKIHYELLRQSLLGKRRSYLDFRSAMLHGERIKAEIDLWCVRNYFTNQNSKTADHGSYTFTYSLTQSLGHTSLLNDDETYRSYLNLDDTFFKGNHFYGYKNRYDDPKRYGFDFEATAEPLVSYNRFNEMTQLANDVRHFGMKSNDFVKYDLNDLPWIEAMMERYRCLTFWYPNGQFKQNMWFRYVTPLNFNKPEFAVIPKNSNTNDNKELMKTIDQLIKTAKIKFELDKKKNLDSPLELCHHIMYSGHKVVKLIKKVKRDEINTRSLIMVSNQLARYFHVLSASNQLIKLHWEMSLPRKLSIPILASPGYKKKSGWIYDDKSKDKTQPTIDSSRDRDKLPIYDDAALKNDHLILDQDVGSRQEIDRDETDLDFIIKHKDDAIDVNWMDEFLKNTFDVHNNQLIENGNKQNLIINNDHDHQGFNNNNNLKYGNGADENHKNYNFDSNHHHSIDTYQQHKRMKHY